MTESEMPAPSRRRRPKATGAQENAPAERKRPGKKKGRRKAALPRQEPIDMALELRKATLEFKRNANAINSGETFRAQYPARSNQSPSKNRDGFYS